MIVDFEIDGLPYLFNSNHAKAYRNRIALALTEQAQL
jgi:hypothetical protein